MVESFSNFYIDTRVSIAQFDSLKKISIGLYFRLLRKVQNKIKNMIDVSTEKFFLKMLILIILNIPVLHAAVK